MIESGVGTVYEAIVRRKSRAAIWERPSRIGGPTARQAEISARAPGEFRNLGQPIVPPFPQTKQIPYKSMH